MYFVDGEHELHYRQLLQNRGNDLRSEYLPLVYILSVPTIWQTWNLSYRQKFPSPIDWALQVEDFPMLSQAHALLVESGISLYSGALMALGEGVQTWDGRLYRLFLQAVELRRRLVFGTGMDVTGIGIQFM